MSPAPLAAHSSRRVLVTGATGYVGGRLVPRLLASGHQVVCLVRDPRKLESRPWSSHRNLTVVQSDLSDEDVLVQALDSCEAAYYLIHSMLAAGSAYRSKDLELARRFAAAAATAGVERIIYLGGLGETGPDLSAHLGSRRDVETALESGGVPVTVLRAAMIIGSGSASFEILRYLVERLPVMITPRWVRTRCQPIGIRDVLKYLETCLEVTETRGRTLDIGGPEVLNYQEILQIMASSLGLPRRRVFPVPVLTPRLSSLWIHLVTPLSARIARPLAEGLRNPVVCRNEDAVRLMPFPRQTVGEAIAAAVTLPNLEAPETKWSDAGVVPGDPDWAGGTSYRDSRSILINAPALEVFRTVSRVGGKDGWFGGNWLWRLRGVLDKLVGGPGLARGRRNAAELAYGDAVGFWRVIVAEPNRLLSLRSEMRLPGVAELDFRITQTASGKSRLEQTARFRPRGLGGLVYWAAVAPLHGIVFHGMLKGIRARAETNPLSTSPSALASDRVYGADSTPPGSTR